MTISACEQLSSHATLPIEKYTFLKQKILSVPLKHCWCHFQQQMTQKTNSAILNSGLGQTETLKKREQKLKKQNQGELGAGEAR